VESKTNRIEITDGSGLNELRYAGIGWDQQL
jgi:hypothetical protein